MMQDERKFVMIYLGSIVLNFHYFNIPMHWTGNCFIGKTLN